MEDQADTVAEDLKVRDLDRQERHLAPQKKEHNHPLNFKIFNSLFLIGLWNLEVLSGTIRIHMNNSIKLIQDKEDKWLETLVSQATT